MGTGQIVYTQQVFSLLLSRLLLGLQKLNHSYHLTISKTINTSLGSKIDTHPA